MSRAFRHWATTSPKSPRVSGSLSGYTLQLVTHPSSRRPPPLSLELTEMQDSLFDTLSSTVESANVLMSKVLSTRAEQHAKLDLREFVEVFNECWSFVVRCEVTCKRMIVGLRGVVVSQVCVSPVPKRALIDSLDRPNHSCRHSTNLASISPPSWSKMNSGVKQRFHLRYSRSSILSWMQQCMTHANLS